MDRTVGQRLRETLGVVGIVGVGRVGAAWGRLLSKAGLELLLHDADRAKAEALASLLPRAQAVDVGLLARDATTVFVTTGDDQIRDAAQSLAERAPRFRLAIHMSGARSVDELDPLRGIGISVGSMHPMQSFRGGEDDWRLFLGCGFAIEGEGPVRAKLVDVVEALGGKSVELRAGSKPLYHAACVAASNFLVVLWHLVERLALECAFTPQQTRTFLAPLAMRTLENLAQVGPLLALTGPYARGDADTVRRHVEALKAGTGTFERALYFALAEGCVAVARDAGHLTEAEAERILTTLRDLVPEGGDEGQGLFGASLDKPSEG